MKDVINIESTYEFYDVFFGDDPEELNYISNSEFSTSEAYQEISELPSLDMAKGVAYTVCKLMPDVNYAYIMKNVWKLVDDEWECETCDLVSEYYVKDDTKLYS